VRIERLIMTGFGRFRGRTLQLEPGLNVLYGPNEAGKSTVQRFLLGMLYGFKKRGQRRDYTEDAARFRPWDGGEYRGALEYVLEGDGRRFRVERLFEPGRDEVRLYDAEAGTDLTGRYQLDRRKELLFAEEQWGLDQEAFRSTAWVGQLGVAGLPAGAELAGRVANLQESGAEELSVQAALRYLEERVRDIGTERAAVKPYGRVLRALDEQRQVLRRAEAAREQTLEWEAGLAETGGALAEIDAELAELSRRLAWAEAAEAAERLERAADEARRVRERLGALREQEARALAELADLERQLGSRRLAAEHGADAVARLDFIDARLAALLPAPGGGALVWAAVAVLLIAAGAAAVALGAGLPIAGLLAVAGLACGALFLSARSGAARLRRQRAGLELEKAQILGRLEAASAGDIRSRAVRYEQLTARREGLQDRLQQIRAELAGLPPAAVGPDPGPGAAAAAELEALRAQLSGAAPAGLRPGVELRADIRRLEGRRAGLQARASDLSARIETILEGLPDTADLRRELVVLEEEKAGCEAELAALQLARETIAQVSGELHREFAPRLNRAMGAVVAELTGRRYGAVRVDESMTLRALAAGERTVDVFSLSGGTVDQFYLGLRLALLQLVTDGQEPVPLILDDPFMQYDDHRAEGAMRYLGAAARGQQVILSTCHSRDARLAEQLGARVIHLADEVQEASEH
jgi:DNA repair exonuclease SbcCD ATPase subunit